MDNLRETIAILGAVGLAVLSVLMAPSEIAKDVVITVVSGLLGYMKGNMK